MIALGHRHRFEVGKIVKFQFFDIENEILFKKFRYKSEKGKKLFRITQKWVSFFLPSTPD